MAASTGEHFMTSQIPERILVDGRRYFLNATPLYRLLASRRMDLCDYNDTRSSNCWRGYVGTWLVRDGMLFLAHLNFYGMEETPLTEAPLRRLLHGTSARDFPIAAHWFNGSIRIPLGRRMVYSHHGFSSWYERQRVLSCKAGRVIRDREVDTGAMLRWAVQRSPERWSWLIDDKPGDLLGPLAWLEPDPCDEELDDEWPPECVAAVGF
jgi:hypothetical protein